MKLPAAAFILIAFCGATTFSENFAPTPLRISAQSSFNYMFDGTEATFPIHVSGTPATVLFLVFTQGKSYNINAVRNGNLGWHYVNKIDTCCYISPPYRFATGDTTITWNGRDQDGRRVPPGDYTYYLWGYDYTSAPKKVTDRIRFPRFDRSFIQTLDSSGNPLYGPVLYDAPQSFDTTGENRLIRTRWVIGGDPEDTSLAETTAYRGWVENSRLALDSMEPRMFFTQSLRSDGNLIMSKWEWAPNGDAILRTDWGENGNMALYTVLDVTQPYYSGPVSDGNDFLLCTNMEEIALGNRCFLNYIEISSGTIVRKADLTSWWADNSGTPKGPSALSFADRMLFLNSPLSPVAMMIDPYAEDDSSLVRWVNGNGDGVGDKALNLDYSDPWSCTDPALTPVAGAISSDQRRFSIFPVEGVSATSFGVFAPDGMGVGSFPLPNMEWGSAYGLHIVDSGSAYDGLYYGGVSNDGDTGVWYTACDSYRGVIVYINDYDMYPHLQIKNPSGGNILTPGSKVPITWILSNDPNVNSTVVRIEFTPDSEVTWITLADSISASTGSYIWTVPDISSSICRIRILTGSVWNITGFFTISGASGVTDHDQPLALTLSNRPNPFNPSTTISFTLPASGQANLTIYDTTGRKVRELFSGQMAAGAHTAVWDGKDVHGNRVSSGLYFVRLSAGKFSTTGKMLLVR